MPRRTRGLPYLGSIINPLSIRLALVLVSREVIPDPPRHSWHPVDDSGVVNFALHPRNEVMPEHIHIGPNTDDILTQKRKDGHGRHCIWREIEEVESVDGHDRLKEFREATDKVSTKESI